MLHTLKHPSLGSITAVYHAQPLRWSDLLTTFFPLGLLTLSPFGYGVWRSYYGYTHYGVSAAESWGRPWFLLSAGISLIFLLYSLRRLRLARFWVAVHTRGVRIHLPPKQLHTLFWDQIEGLETAITLNTFLGFTARTRHNLTIYAINQIPIHLDDRLPHFLELISNLKTNVYPRLRPQIHQAYQAGKTLYFGPLKISKKGLDFEKLSFVWRELDQITIHKGNLQVHSPQRRTLKIPTRKIINIELLLELFEMERV